MNSADLNKSPRLRRALGTLEAAAEAGEGWMTTRDLIWAAGICAVNSVIAELRDNGCTIETRQVPGVEGRRWEYRLTHAPAGWRDQA